MRYMLFALLLLIPAATANAGRVRMCGARGCYWVQTETITAPVVERVEATNVSATVTVNSNQSSRAVRRPRLFPIFGQRTVVRVRTGRPRLLWWR